MIVLEWLGWALALVGALVVLVGAVGLVRMPDLFTRMHASGVIDGLGAGSVLVGLALVALAAGSWTTVTRLLMVLAFVWLSSPTACHALARTAHVAGLVPWTRERPIGDTKGEAPPKEPGR